MVSQVFGGSWDAVVSTIKIPFGPAGTAALFLLELAIAKMCNGVYRETAARAACSDLLCSSGAVGALSPGLLKASARSCAGTPARWCARDGAFFAGILKAPTAGVVMVCEMTGYSLLPGLLPLRCTTSAFPQMEHLPSQVKNSSQALRIVRKWIRCASRDDGFRSDGRGSGTPILDGEWNFPKR